MMPYKKPSLADALEKNNNRLHDIAERTALWQKKRNFFVIKMALASAIILPVSARMMAYGGNMSWLAYILFFCMGGLLGWLIATYAIGMLRSMFLYLAGAFPIWLICYVFGWWASAVGPHLTNYGPLILMVIGWLGWIILGSILGLISDTNDSDTIQI